MLVAAAIGVAAPAAAIAQTATSAAPAPDPARLAIAKRVADQLVQDGMYKRMLGANFDKMMQSVVGMTGDLPIRQFASAAGVSEAEAAELGETTLREVMEIYDPHWEERQQKMMSAMMSGMGDLMSSLEPRIRTALARAYAREFSLAELQEMQGFFATPAGSHYARTSMELMMGPDMMEAMSEAVPEIMKAMPALIAKGQEATKDLPAPRDKSDLTPAERKKIEALLGQEAGSDGHADDKESE
ncbi:DUF2059 domain-containing protein [Sphingomonas sp. RS6]